MSGIFRMLERYFLCNTNKIRMKRGTKKVLMKDQKVQKNGIKKEMIKNINLLKLSINLFIKKSNKKIKFDISNK